MYQAQANCKNAIDLFKTKLEMSPNPVSLSWYYAIININITNIMLLSPNNKCHCNQYGFLIAHGNETLPYCFYKSIWKVKVMF